jgi:hypothetical protein
MLAKVTTKNQITLPKKVMMHFNTQYFDVQEARGKIMLTPVTMSPQKKSADQVRAKLAQLGITQDDVADAIKWARGKL